MTDETDAIYAQADSQCRRPAESSAPTCLLHPYYCGGRGQPWIYDELEQAAADYQQTPEHLRPVVTGSTEPRCRTCSGSGWIGARQGHQHVHCACGTVCGACRGPCGSCAVTSERCWCSPTPAPTTGDQPSEVKVEPAGADTTSDTSPTTKETPNP